MSLLDILFPKKCINCRSLGSYVCPTCFSYISFLEHGSCVVCQRQAIYSFTHPGCKKKYTIDGVFSSLVYAGVVKKLVYSFKYQPYLTNLQGLLTDLFYEGLIQKEPFMRILTTDSIFIPIPLHTFRYRKRGYNQSMLLAHGIGKRFGIAVGDYLTRVKNTQPQMKLTQEERQENIKDAFALKREFFQTKFYKKAFLVDDVVTSGATLKEAARILKKAGVGEVWGITLSHGQ